MSGYFGDHHYIDEVGQIAEHFHGPIDIEQLQFGYNRTPKVCLLFGAFTFIFL